jgi:carbonic anhydrase
MTKVLDDVLAANQTYVERFGDKGTLALPPARRFAILTCMNARLDPAKFAGLAEGDAHVIPQCWWSGQRRCHPLAYHLPQAARHQ